jgi:hypothetical protein
MTALIIGTEEKAALEKLRELASSNPIDMPKLVESIKTPEGKAAHRRMMTAQTVDLPVAFKVTYSIETGHPIGTCRHMSLSVQKKGRVPNQQAVEMVMAELGYYGTIADCIPWIEDLQGHGKAINVLQPVSAPAGQA